MTQVTITEVRPIGQSQKVLLVKGTATTTDGRSGSVELKAWANGGYVEQLKVGETVSIDAEEKESEYNGETRKERWIKTANGVGQKAQGKGGGGGFKGSQKTPAGEASILTSVIVKAATEIHNEAQRLSFEQERINSERAGKPMDWKPKADVNAIKVLVKGMSEIAEEEVRRLMPLMEAK